jgi:hypothetical protein
LQVKKTVAKSSRVLANQSKTLARSFLPAASQ